jgi:hypothetical protein
MFMILLCFLPPENDFKHVLRNCVFSLVASLTNRQVSEISFLLSILAILAILAILSILALLASHIRIYQQTPIRQWELNLHPHAPFMIAAP